MSDDILLQLLMMLIQSDKSDEIKRKAIELATAIMRDNLQDKSDPNKKGHALLS